ncbi:hypothetical protein [Actinoplanes sp. NPDC051494]|uniref:hypothetical protein n=1 Tax=Actinoplanes sp. NPDC051494 TaxID=3363907 RepID=UPI0037AA4242
MVNSEAEELAAIADLAGRPDEEREGYDQHDELGAFQHDGTVLDVLADLVDEALHRDRCYPWTAARVPLLAALAVDERLTAHHRARLLLDLYLIATVGRRHDEESADTIAATAAVAGELPRILARTGDSALYARLAAALAEACSGSVAPGEPVALGQLLTAEWEAAEDLRHL